MMVDVLRMCLQSVAERRCLQSDCQSLTSDL
jgi:hypothetical protein